MIPDYDDFANGLRDALADFNRPAAAPPVRRRAAPIGQTPGVTVILAVRRGRLKPDEIFEYKSHSISRLQAQIEAERAARAQGYIVGHVIDYKTGEQS